MRTASTLSPPPSRSVGSSFSECREARGAECKQRHSLLSKCLALAAPLRCCPLTTFQSHEVSHAIVSNDLVALRRALTMRPNRCISMCQPGVNGGIDGTAGNALHLAVCSAHANVVKELIANGADVNLFDVTGMAPLHLAARRGDAGVVEALLQSHQVLSVDVQDVQGHSALQYAVELAHWQCVAALLRAGALAENLVLPDSSSRLRRAAEASAVCSSLWRPAVRFCAVVCLPSPNGSTPARTAECTHPALVAEDESRFKHYLNLLTDSAQLTKHRDLTVSTEVGMMHYNLLAPQGLLFMVITIPDMLQSEAFRFLENLRNRFLREFPQAARTGSSAIEPFSVPQAEALVRDVCTSAAYVPFVEPRLSPAYGGPSLPQHALVWMETARSLNLDKVALPTKPLSTLDSNPNSKLTPTSFPAARGQSWSPAPRTDETNVPLGSLSDEKASMAYTHEMVGVHLRDQIAGVRARVEGASRPHALVLLRHHKWSYGEVVNALEAKPTLLLDFFGDAFASGASASPSPATRAGVKAEESACRLDLETVATDSEAEEEVVDWEEGTTESDARLRSDLRDQILAGCVPLCYPRADGAASSVPRAAQYSPVPDATIERLLSAELRSRYENSIVTTFLTEANDWQPCPTGCGHAIHCTVGEQRKHTTSSQQVVDVSCLCGAKFCWQCRARWPKLEPHAPLPCEMISGWQSAMLEDDASDGSAPNSARVAAVNSTPRDGEPMGGIADAEQSSAEGREMLRAARGKVQAYAAAAIRHAPLRRALAHLEQVVALVHEAPTAGSDAVTTPARSHRSGNGKGASSLTPIMAAFDVLVEGRRLLRFSVIAQYMLTRPLAHSGRTGLDGTLSGSARSRALKEMPVLSRRLGVLVELLTALLDIELDTPTPADQALQHTGEHESEPVSPANGASAGAPSFDKAVVGKRAVALVKHAILLHRTDELKAEYATLGALTTCARAAIAELDAMLLSLVQAAPARAVNGHASGAEGSTVAALVEAYIPGFIGSVASFWGGNRS